MLKRPELSKLSVAEKDVLILELFERLDALMKTVQTLQQRIDTLEGQLRKDSHNSHKPPRRPTDWARSAHSHSANPAA